MRDNSSATVAAPITLPVDAGMGLAALGVLAFSLTFPMTEFALTGLDPFLVGVGRAAVAGLAAALCLAAVRAPRPTARQCRGLAGVGVGVVFGFPLLSSLALDTGASVSHSGVVIGLLPAATAVLAVLRAHERPPRAFWAACALGAAVVAGFALLRDAGRLSAADLLLLGALLLGAYGYAEGGRLAREMPGWRVISWGLVLALPISVPVTAVLLATTGPQWSARTGFGLGYVSFVSMFLGFFAWYAGMARAGIARASQLQLMQPLLTIGWSALLLGEGFTTLTWVAALGVLVCVAWTQRSRGARTRLGNGSK